MRFPWYLQSGLLAVGLLALNVQASGNATRFRVGVVITGPGFAVENHPRWNDARVLHVDANSLFQAIDGTVAQVRERVKNDPGLGGWRWVDLDGQDGGWRAMGHSPQGHCMGVEARGVVGMEVVRLHTWRCDGNL